MTPLHFEVLQLVLFFLAMGFGLAEIGDNAAANNELEDIDNGRKRFTLYVALLLFWWLIIPVGGFIMVMSRWLKGGDKSVTKKGKGPWG